MEPKRSRVIAVTAPWSRVVEEARYDPVGAMLTLPPMQKPLVRVLEIAREKPKQWVKLVWKHPMV